MRLANIFTSAVGHSISTLYLQLTIIPENLKTRIDEREGPLLSGPFSQSSIQIFFSD